MADTKKLNGDYEMGVTASDKSSRDGGCFLTKTAGVAVAVGVGLVLTAAVLMTYYIPDRSCPSNPLPTIAEPEENKMPTPVEVPDVEPTVEGRLPDTIIPYHYDVRLKVFMDENISYPSGDGSFMDIKGDISIYVDCEKSTNEIVVHNRLLTVESGSVKDTDSGQEITVESIDRSQVDNQWTIIKTETQLQKDRRYIITLASVGTLNHPDNRGFYFARYTENDEDKHFLATQFESRHARKAFPCLDEPALKATFTTTLVYPYQSGRIALSNTNIESSDVETDINGNIWNVTQYEETVKMSTYLNAYTIGEWACIYNTTRYDIGFGVCSQPSLIDQAEYALYTGMDQISMFEDLFNLSYVPVKMDMPAVPVFSPGAMENWGLILYREVYIIYDPNFHTPARKKGVAGVIAHELVHQWFGNAVTMEWWDDLWLNEGFADFFQYYGLDYSEKGFETFDQLFLKDNTYLAFVADQVGTSRPIITPSTSSRMIYQKAGTLIEMMRSFLGEDALFEGLRRYLHKYEWGNTVSDNLWQSLTETVDDLWGMNMKESFGYDMKDIMDTWFLQMGFPVVTLTRTGTNLITAEQEHFLLDPNDIPQDKYYTNLGYVWHIPLTYTHEAQKEYQAPTTLWLHRTGGNMVIEGLTSMQWYLANINQSAYIRVNYDIDNWRLLAKQLLLHHQAIPVRSRAHLIDDAFHLGQAHRLDHVIAIEMMQYLYKEEDYMPWQSFAADQYYTKYMLWRSATYAMYEKYVRHQMSNNYDTMGWEFDYFNEDTDYYRRLDTLRISCDYSHPGCVESASAQYKEWMDNPDDNKIETDMRSNVYCTAIRYGGEVEWKFAYERQKEDGDERGRLQSAMACSRTPWNLQRYMEEALEGTEFSASTTIAYVRDNSGLGFDLAWDFTLQNFDALLETNNPNTAYGIVWSFASKMNTEKDLEKLNAFGEKHYDMPGTEANDFYDAVTKVQTNIKWMERNMMDISTFLKAVSYNMNNMSM
ncbi:aminopeptidase N-like [Glandiceps talaboti]